MWVNISYTSAKFIIFGPWIIVLPKNAASSGFWPPWLTILPPTKIKLANFIFVGGSLVNHGGQNPIEAASLGKTIIHGPNIMNFADVYEILSHMKLTYLVNNERQLKIYIDDKYKKSNDSVSVSRSSRIMKEGNQAINNSIEAINQLL